MELKSAQRLGPAADLVRTLEEAGAIADGVAQPVSTTHVVLALFTVPNPAEVLLKERDIDENALLAALAPGAEEPKNALRSVLRTAEETALRCDSTKINTLHLLVALLREKSCIAHHLLAACVGPVPAFRNQVLSYLTGVLPRRLRDPIRAAKNAPFERVRPLVRRPLLHDPTDDWVVPKETMLEGDDLLDEREEHVSVLAPADDHHPPKGESDTPYHHPSVLESALPSLLQPPTGASVSPRRFKPVTRAPTLLPTAYDLDPTKFPWLTSLGRNLSSLADHGQLDPTIGRASEIEQIIDVLGKRRANNPCLVGDPGVGKSAIAEGLAVKLVRGDRDVASLHGKVIIELDMGRITAGTALRGSFSERMQGLKKDVERAQGRVIIFIDEIHTLMGAGGSQDSPQDAANELKAALARGAFPCIGSTTLDEYRKFIEQDPALDRRFVRILIEEPDHKETVAILQGAAPLYEEHHGVAVHEDALFASVELASRFIFDKKLPGKAIDLLDLTMSRAKRHGLDRIGREDVARVCADVAKVPIDRLLLEDRERFLSMERFLGERVIGHTEVIADVADTIRRNYAGFSHRRPMGSFMFLGPSGVGKTELAKALADFLYGSPDALLRLDMSEYSEGHTVSRLVGAPPGYVGHHDGGQLTEAIRRRPHAVVLLDEIEKAHPDVLPLLLQILDEGRLTDAKGRTVTFEHAVVVLTSNAGTDSTRKKARVGFGSGGKGDGFDAEAFRESARAAFAPELWGRIEQKAVFRPLVHDELVKIARIMVDASLKVLADNRSIEARYDQSLLDHVVEQGGFDAATGARPMRRAVQRLIETPLSEAILRGQVKDGQRVRLSVNDGKIKAVIG